MGQLFKKSATFDEYKLTHQLKYNFKFWLDHNLCEQGAFFNVTIPTIGWQGFDESRLMPVNDPRHTEPDGTFCVSGAMIWEGRGKEWVWESGLVNVPSQPIEVSGVFVNGTFHDKDDTGEFAHIIDYSNGRIVFAGPVDINANVQAEYSYRRVFVGFADQDEFRQIIREAVIEQVEEFDSAPGSGLAVHTKEHRIYLPAIFIQPDEGNFEGGLQLGGGQIRTKNVILHIITDHESDRDLLVDLLELQDQSRITFFDLNKIPFPLEFDGSLSSGALTWTQLTTQFKWKKIRIDNARSSVFNPGAQGGLWRGQVRYSIEMDFGFFD